MEKLSPPVRIFALVAVLVAVAGALLMFTTGRSTETIAPVVLPPKAAPSPAAKVKPKVAATKPVAKAKAKAKTKPKPTLARAAAAAPRPAPKVPEPATGFPVAVDTALANHELVIVSLVVPGARVDELAAAEARAGAKLAGVGFLALNVLNESVARSLLAKLGTLEDPSLLMVKRGGELALTLTGFVDRDTVAQAAANASA